VVSATKLVLVFGGILVGLALLMAAGVGFLILLLDEAGEDGRDITGLSSLLSLSSSWRGGQENDGNEFTGQISGWLFGIACVPVAFSLTARLVGRRVALRPGVKGLHEWSTRVNRRYLMPFHTYLSIPALALAIFHLELSSCPNPLPEWGLILAGILVATGVIVKLRIVPRLAKRIYQFHSSLVVSAMLVGVLLAGHVIMD
jgi:hypothetical protein